MFTRTTATKKIIKLDKDIILPFPLAALPPSVSSLPDGTVLSPRRIRVLPGGTSAGKTIANLLFLIAKAQKDITPTLTSVVSESVPHLKRGAIRDFLNIMQQHGYFKEKLWNKTDFIYTFETGSKMEFFSSDNGDKLRGARRDRLFINEANNVPFDAFEQLEVRTKEFIILDYNPTNEFWYYTEVKPNRDDWIELTLTYLDNESLDKNIVESIEQRKNRKGWWQVYGLGQLGEVEGKIYKDWAIIPDEIPHEARLEGFGIDFGYSNDPTAIIAVYYYNGGYILDEITYKKELSNKQIADIILNQTNVPVLSIADSAEPKSIDDIASYGVLILPAEKGADSVRNGISILQEQRISMTRKSVNLINEYRNYLWRTDKDGKFLSPPVPESGKDHALDAVRYKIVSLVKNQPNGGLNVYIPDYD